MTHDTAARTVLRLVPEIEKRGAEDVLVEFATEEDLPPAQLEKLGQVYNTLRTVMHVDNATDGERGKTVPMLDVPALVVGYATGAGQEKVATGPHSFTSHDPNTVDLNRLIRGEMRKAAAAEVEVKGPPQKSEETLRQAITRGELADALLDAELDIKEEISKLACDIFTAAPQVGDDHFTRDVSGFEREALQYASPYMVKAAAAHMEKFAAAHRTKLLRFDYQEKVASYAFDLGHEIGRKFAALGDAVAELAVIKAAADHPLLNVPPPGDTLKDDDIVIHDDELGAAIADATEGGLGIGIDPDAADPAAPEADVERKTAPAGPSLEQQMREAEQEGLVNQTEETPARGGGGGGEDSDSGKTKGKADTKESGGISLDDILTAAAAPIAATSTVIQDAARAADTTLQDIVGKERQNKAQQAADVSVEDIRRAMAVRRMIGTDPVLKEADPKEVLEAYNSVVARNPDLAGDMMALRLILREAVSYDGLTLDSQKMLAEIRRNSEQASTEAENRVRRQYAVGGASPLSIVKS